MRRSTTRVKRIGQLFHWVDEDERAMLVQVVRLCVLYEDFQIEMTGAMEESIPVLDSTTRDTRRFYFVRRHVATFAEVEGAVNVLCKNNAFKRIKRAMGSHNRRQWDDAVAVFGRYHDRIKKLRNDVGGHFHDAAASFALSEVDPETVGLFEVFLRGSGADVRLKFAYEFVAASLVRHRPPEQPEQEFIEALFEMMLKAMKEVIDSVHVIVDEVLLRRAL